LGAAIADLANHPARAHRGRDRVPARLLDRAPPAHRDFLGICKPGKTFEVLIQLGAILAVFSVHAAKLINIAVEIPYDERARRFVLCILLAFLPAAVVGAGAHDFIKKVLFESPMLNSVILVVGGIILLVIDRLPLPLRCTDVMDYPPSLAFKIGLSQCLALNSPAFRARAPPSSPPCCLAPTSARRRSSRFSSPCRPWPAPSLSTSGIGPF
jgi:hypothetical protein